MGKTRLPSFSPNPATIAILLLFAFVFPSWGEELESRQPAWVELDVDRPGSDFKILWLRGGAEACQEACAQNPLCKSYTYVRAGVEGRMEGCWLKDSVPLPVADNCCVSGVKTGEAVTVAIREPFLAVKDLGKEPVLPPGETAVLEPPARKPAEPEEKIPATGSGKRIFAGMNFAAAPPKGAEAPTGSPPILFHPSVREIGTGRRVKTGVNFSAAPPVTVRPALEPLVPEVPAAETGTGKREIRGVQYSASPKSEAEIDRTGTAMRKVSGVDITAVPPHR